MATYAAYRHIELDNVGYGKKRYVSQYDSYVIFHLVGSTYEAEDTSKTMSQKKYSMHIPAVNIINRFSPIVYNVEHRSPFFYHDARYWILWKNEFKPTQSWFWFLESINEKKQH